VTPGRGSILTPGYNLNNFGRGHLDDVLYEKKALGLVVSEKKIFENCLL